MLLVLVVVANGLWTAALAMESRRVGRIARLHVVMQFELSSGDWDGAEEDLDTLESIPGGSWKALSYMVRKTIEAGRGMQIAPPFDAAPKFDEATQSYYHGPVVVQDEDLAFRDDRP